MGGPVSAHENEITTREPKTHPVYGKTEAIMYCVKVVRIMAVVLSGTVSCQPEHHIY
jgi:hypothetical protein